MVLNKHYFLDLKKKNILLQHDLIRANSSNRCLLENLLGLSSFL